MVFILQLLQLRYTVIIKQFKIYSQITIILQENTYNLQLIYFTGNCWDATFLFMFPPYH